jgi:hypothetical protein
VAAALSTSLSAGCHGIIMDGLLGDGRLVRGSEVLDLAMTERRLVQSFGVPMPLMDRIAPRGDLAWYMLSATYGPLNILPIIEFWSSRTRLHVSEGMEFNELFGDPQPGVAKTLKIQMQVTLRSEPCGRVEIELNESSRARTYSINLVMSRHFALSSVQDGKVYEILNMACAMPHREDGEDLQQKAVEVRDRIPRLIRCMAFSREVLGASERVYQRMAEQCPGIATAQCVVAVHGHLNNPLTGRLLDAILEVEHKQPGDVAVWLLSDPAMPKDAPPDIPFLVVGDPELFEALPDDALHPAVRLCLVRRVCRAVALVEPSDSVHTCYKGLLLAPATVWRVDGVGRVTKDRVDGG